MSIDRLIDEVIRREGGYVNHKDDRGGATKFGITEATARRYGYNGPIRDMPRSEAHRIYKFQYYLRPSFDKIDHLAPIIAEEMFDTGVNMGQRRAIEFLQRALNVFNRQQKDWRDIPVDGAIGGQTIGALAAFIKKRGRHGLIVLRKTLECLQGAKYVELCERREANESFLFGWIDHRIGQLDA